MGDQVVRHEEKKWGSKVSAKLFMDREYVVKHIHNKHKAVVDAQKDKVCAPRQSPRPQHNCMHSCKLPSVPRVPRVPR